MGRPRGGMACARGCFPVRTHPPRLTLGNASMRAKLGRGVKAHTPNLSTATHSSRRRSPARDVKSALIGACAFYVVARLVLFAKPRQLTVDIVNIVSVVPTFYTPINNLHRVCGNRYRAEGVRKREQDISTHNLFRLRCCPSKLATHVAF